MTNKNKILIATLILGQIPSLFFGMTYRLNLALFVERSTRVDFFAMYYVNAVSFLILAYCLRFNKGIDKRVSKLIFIITILDFFHLLFAAKQGYGMTKVGIGMTVVAYEFGPQIMASIKSAYLEMLIDLRELKTKITKLIKTPLKKWRT